MPSARSPLEQITECRADPAYGWPTDEMYRQFADAAADALLGYLDGKDGCRPALTMR